jgi:hypothetical protein
LCDPKLRRRLTRVRIPTLCLWGENDRIVPSDYGRAYAQALPHARFELIPEAEHLPQIEQQECLQVARPSTLQEVQEVTEAFLQHYNDERPHQGRACENVPPRVAFPRLPLLPALPERVDPDAWLSTFDQKMYLRHVGRDGCVDLDLSTYYLGPQLAKRTMLWQVLAR